MTIEIVVMDTDVFSIVYLAPGRRDDRRDPWRAALVGKTVVIDEQTRGEVLAGALISAWGEQRRSQLTGTLSKVATIPVDDRVADRYSELKAACVRVGHGLGDKLHDGDRWIAASAVTIGASLLSGDRIYSGAPGLRLLDRYEVSGSGNPDGVE